MIQLNSQEITEATELHPVTTCEQGGREDGKTGRQGAFERLNTDYTDKKRITRIRARPAQKTEKCKTEKWESFNRQDTRAPGSHQGSILFQFVGHRNKLEQNGTLKPLAALLVCGVHSQSDGFKSALASFIARSSTRTSPRFGLRSGVKADMFLTWRDS